MNYPLLKTELDLPHYENLSAEDAAALLNAPSIEYHVSVSSVDIATYLMETPCAAVAPLSLYNCLSLTYRNGQVPLQVQAIAENIIDLATGVDRPIALPGNPQYEGAFALLVQAGRYTHGEAEGILNLGKKLRSRAQELLGEAVTESHINTARNLDSIAALRTLEERINSAHGDVLGVVQQARAALEAGELVDAPNAAGMAARFGETLLGET